MPTFSIDWDSAFEATPSGTESLTSGDDRIRELKVAVRETFEVEHGSMDGDDTRGKHTPGGVGVVYRGTADQIQVYLSSTAPPDGALFDESDTGKVRRYNATTGSLETIAVRDHGVLDGLSDDDHTQYLLADGSRDLSGVVKYDSHPTFDTDEQLVDKKYADDKASSEASAVAVTKYDSGWFAVSNNAEYTKAHGLGAIPDVVLVQAADSASPTTIYQPTVAGDGRENWTAPHEGCQLKWDATNVVLKTLEGYFQWGGTKADWAYARITAIIWP